MANVYEIVTQQIIERLKEGVVPWQRPWRQAGLLPTNLVTLRPYQGINLMLLSVQGFASPYWATFKQIQSLGGRVRKGEKSSLVVFWKIQEKTIERDGEITTETYPVLRYYRVFNVEQTEGLEQHIPHATSTTTEPIPECVKLISAYPDPPRIQHGDKACYNPATDTVTMPPQAAFCDLEHYYVTLFHELAHSTGHPSRLNRQFGDMFGDHRYSFEELIAEFAAAFLCAIAGIAPATQTNSVAYIQSWVKALSEHPRWLVQAASKAQKAADYIQGKLTPKTEEQAA